MNRSAFDVESALRDDRWIRGVARGLLRDRSEADDALQEARLTLLRSPAPRLEDPRPWLARVALNFLRKRRREDVRRLRRERRAARPESVHASPEEAIERVEVRRQVLEAVLALEEPYRSTVVQRYFEEMSPREIAVAAGIPIGTVKTRVARALAILRRQLEARLGGEATWTMLLVPFLAAELRASGVVGAASSGTQAAAGKGLVSSGSGSLCLQGGVIGMSSKGIAFAVGVSGLLVLGGLAFIQRSLDGDRAPATSGDLARVSRSGDRRPSESIPAPEVAEAPRGADSGGISPGGQPLSGAEQAPRAAEESTAGDEARAAALPASPEVLALREAYRDLKKRFGEGGRAGWREVGLDIARLQELIVAGQEGFDELLALLDEEADGSFLEAVLHHLPMGKSEHRQGILDNEDLRQEIWARFEEAEDPERRAAFLRFFAYERSLGASRMRDFLALARGEADARVREVAVDAIASHRDLLGETWDVLAHTLQHDTSFECREHAIQGLAHVDSDGARALVRAAFISPDERLRAAAVSSAAGDRIPEELTGGDPAAYLVSELRAARTQGYKRAILKRIVGHPGETCEEAIRQAIAGEEDMGMLRSYREALEAIEEWRSARPR